MITIIFKIKYTNIFNVFFYLYLIIITIDGFFNIFNYYMMFGIGIFFSIFLIFYTFNYLKHYNKKHLNFFVVIFLIMFFGALNYLIRTAGFATFNMIVFSFVNLSFAFYYIKSEYKFKGIKYLFWVVTFYFLYFIIFRIYPGEALTSHSRNYISVYYLLIITLYYIEDYKKNNTIKFIPAIFFLIICVWAYGRTSVFVGVSFFISVFLLQFKFDYKRVLLVLLGTSFAVILLIVFVEDISYYFDYAFQRFYERNTFEDPRFLILNNYIKNINITSFLMGFNVNTSEHLFLDWGQPHNSFIRLHHRFGIWGLLKIFILGFALLRAVFINKLIFLLIFLILFRSFFDIMIFAPNQFDFVVYIVLYYSLFESTIFKNKSLKFKKL